MAGRAALAMLVLLAAPLAGCPLPAAPGAGPDAGSPSGDRGVDRERDQGAEAGDPGDGGDTDLSQDPVGIADLPDDARPPAADRFDVVATADLAGDPGVDPPVNPPQPDGVECIGATCQPGQVCCVTGGRGTPLNGNCQASGVACNGSALQCDGPEDCPGQICCSTFASGSAPGAGCADTCGNDNQVALCHAAGDCPVQGDSCCPLDGVSYAYCATTC